MTRRSLSRNRVPSLGDGNAAASFTARLAADPANTTNTRPFNIDFVLEEEARSLGVALHCLIRMTLEEEREYSSLHTKYGWLCDRRRAIVEARFRQSPTLPPTAEQLAIEAELDRIEERMGQIRAAATARS